MPDPHYDTFNLLQRILVKKKIIINITVVAVIFGCISYIIIPRKYKAETILILKNPLYADRNNIYNTETKFLDYVANDEDVDRLFSLAASDSLLNNIISIMHLATVYQYDSTSPEQIMRLKKYFKQNLNITRNEYKNIVVSYKDKDPVRAAAIANLTTNLLDHALRNFYNGMREAMYQSVMNRIHSEDSAIAVLTDTLINLRETYGIYDIISPARNNLMLSNMEGEGREHFGKGIEWIQNIESVKDELVSDRAKHITLANQYATSTHIDEMPLAHIIQTAKPPLKYWFRDLLFTVCISAFLGFLISSVYVLLAGYYNHTRTSRI